MSESTSDSGDIIFQDAGKVVIQVLFLKRYAISLLVVHVL